jgi:Fic family protein
MNPSNLPILPLGIELETRKVLKQLPAAHAALAELKGLASTIPNQKILLNTLVIREARDSSAVENIITSHDELYKAQLDLRGFHSLSAKEVQNYVRALNIGFDFVKTHGMLTNNAIKQIQQALEQNDAGFRKQPGTVLKNEITGAVVYIPPQDHQDIQDLMDNLESYINDRESDDIDPLVKMAIIHHQFESIHPFYDGNGRTGRIINILFLILQGLQDLPILYLSRFIIRNKHEYYQLLQSARKENQWDEWLIYMIRGVEETARDTIAMIQDIRALMLEYKHRIRRDYKFYSQDLINNLFSHPYTKIELLVRDLGVSRITAANYLNTLHADGLLGKEQLGRSNYYINEALFTILSRP